MYKRENQSFKTMKSAAGDMNQHSIACTVLTGLPRPSYMSLTITYHSSSRGIWCLWSPPALGSYAHIHTQIHKHRHN